MKKHLQSPFAMNYKTLLFFFIFPFLSLSAEEEIRVHLPTQSTLQPIYIGKILQEQPNLPKEYLAQLEAVLVYDFNFNGSTQVLSRSSEKEELLSSSALDLFRWKQLGIPFAIKCQLVGKTLMTFVLNAEKAQLKALEPIPLSGNLNQDRRQIHKIADTAHQLLFGQEGVAMTRVLFAYEPNPLRTEGKEWLSEIWECDWDGANARQVTRENSYCITPVPLPKSSNQFLYVSYKSGQPKIYMSSNKGEKGKRVSDLRGNQLLPAISPQRNRVAFICDAAGRSDLFVQTINFETGECGKPTQLFSYPRSTQASPTFSPDGSKIAFVSDKDGGMRIYLIPSTSHGKRAVAQMISKAKPGKLLPILVS